MTNDYTRPGIDPYWVRNPLAVGTYCDTCGTRLDRPDRACPHGPHDEVAA